jgi:hypothetical protein
VLRRPTEVDGLQDQDDPEVHPPVGDAAESSPEHD